MEVVAGFDLGSTHLKYVVVNATGEVIHQDKVACQTWSDGLHSEQDPDQAAGFVMDAVDQLSRRFQLAAIGFSAAMHTFMAVGQDSRPLTRNWTWMDRRAAHVAARLRAQPLGQLLHQSTGTPVHAMSPLAKWLYYRTTTKAPAHPVALKDYVVYRLTGYWATDVSTAAASGFLGLDGQWQPEALALAGLSVRDLPLLKAMDDVVAGPQGVPVVLGGSDGAMAHRQLGIGPNDGQAVLAMGTSGAVRVTLADVPSWSPALFAYTMGTGRGVLVGAALSNAGNVLAWMADLFQTTVADLIGSGLSALADKRPLPLLLPYLYGERSPWWREDIAGALTGLRPGHGRPELAAALLLALGTAYAKGLRDLEAVAGPVAVIRAGSGLLNVPGLADFLATGLGRPIILQSHEDASVLGAAGIAAKSLGWPEPGGDLAAGTRHLPAGDPSLRERITEYWIRTEEAVAGIYPGALSDEVRRFGRVDRNHPGS